MKVRNHFFCILFLLLFQVLILSDQYSEDELKAAYIFKFIQFIECPYFNQDSLEIVVINDTSIYKKLIQYKDVQENSQQIEIRHFNKCNLDIDSNNFSILFLGSETQERAESWLKSLRNKSVLTIGESEGFIDQGGIINFFLKNEYLKYEINDQVAKQNKITIHSILLGNAERVIK